MVPIGTSPDSHETLQYAVEFASHFSAATLCDGSF